MVVDKFQVVKRSNYHYHNTLRIIQIYQVTENFSSFTPKYLRYTICCQRFCQRNLLLLNHNFQLMLSLAKVTVEFRGTRVRHKAHVRCNLKGFQNQNMSLKFVSEKSNSVEFIIATKNGTCLNPILHLQSYPSAIGLFVLK